MTVVLVPVQFYYSEVPELL